MNCSLGHENTSESAFCSTCGRRLPTKVAATAGATTAAPCGHVNAPNSVHCTTCGRKVLTRSGEDPAAATPIPPTGDAAAAGAAAAGAGRVARAPVAGSVPVKEGFLAEWGCLLLMLGAVLIVVMAIAGACMGPSKSSDCSDMYGPSYHYTNDDGGYCVNTYNGDRRPYS